jgi:hypothetical protein
MNSVMTSVMVENSRNIQAEMATDSWKSKLGVQGRPGLEE